MAQKFPENLPPKGRGRVDDKHQIALLTDFEVAALNTLKNRDKERGFPSGSGPEIRALAAQNSRPFEFVNYRGERIPSLNDFSDGKGKNEGAGEQEARQQTQSGGDYGGSNDWAARERRRKEKIKREREARLKREKEEYEKKQKDLKAIQDYLDWYDNVNKQGSTDYQDFEGENYGTDDRPERDPGYRPPQYGEPGYEEPPRQGGTDQPPPPPPDDDGGMTHEEFLALTEEYDLKPEFADWKGEMHWSQDSADAANAGYLQTEQTGEIGGAEGFKYGSEVTDAEGNITDETLTGGYRSAYEQMLADAYDAAETGVGLEVMGSGGLGYTEDPYQKLQDAQEGQSAYLDELATAYQGQAQSQYDDWLQENTDNINALKTLEDVQNYEWTAMPEYDTDLSGGIDPETGQWDADWMPEFYEGFTKEYGQDYNAPEGWQYDEEGNPIPGTFSTATTSPTTEEEPGEGEVSRTARSAPGITPGKKPLKRGGSGVAQFGRSSARYV